MEIQRQTGILTVTGLRELSAATARSFCALVGAALTPDLNTLEIDLSQTEFVDGGGLGALISLYRTATRSRRGPAMAMRLLNPTPPVRQMIELTRMHHFFEIVSNQKEPSNAPAAENPHETDPASIHFY